MRFGKLLVNCSARISTDTDNNKKILSLPQPKIVNGCQTVNSIKSAVSEVPASQRSVFDRSYVLLKVLVIPQSSDNEENDIFYRNVVKYTNRQTAVPDKAFTVSQFDSFRKLQEGFKKRGLFLCVKMSDKEKFRSMGREDKLNYFHNFEEYRKLFPETISENPCAQHDFAALRFDLEKVLQVFIAFFNDPAVAIQEKSHLLKQKTDLFKDYVVKLQDHISYDDLILLTLLFNYADKNKKIIIHDQSVLISPFYIISFLGRIIRKNAYDEDFQQKTENISKILTNCFRSTESWMEVYKGIRTLCQSYMNICCQHNRWDYNTMIKHPLEKNDYQLAYDNWSITVTSEEKYLKLPENSTV
ncbi:MAG: AIPR family protein [Spirochaetia bacterium]|nr:AIPR family protein [Spirochaetia bacterium]